MSQLNAVSKEPSYISRLFEMQNLSSNFQQFRDAMDYSDNLKMAETSFIETPSNTTPESGAGEAAEAGEEAATAAASTGESVAEGLEIGPLAAIGAVKTMGDITSNVISSDLSSQYTNVSLQNSQAHGLDAVRQSAMVNQANQQSLSNAQHGMSIGSWFGSLGAYLGYAFSNTNVASSLNMNTGYSTQGMVNPELQDSVATTYASTEASDNQSIIAQ
jgi:hypothetical protein